MDIQQAISKVVSRHNLSQSEMCTIMHTIMSGKATDAQIAGFIVALRMKGETIDEITAAAKVMRELATQVAVQQKNLIDIVGTGGDGLNTFNISTTVSFVVAAAGAQVAKVGNRAVSSKCGSADVLEASGFNINLNALQVARCIDKLGIGFMFAPMHHSAMRHAVAPRKQLGIRSLFNLLGPLTNPANAQHNLIGVFSKDWLMPVAITLQNLHSKHAMVIHSQDGMDEISICAATDVVELNNNEISSYVLDPKDFNLYHPTLDDIIIEDAQQSVKLMLDVFNNHAGAARDIVILNAAAALYCADVCSSIEQAVTRADSAIASGAALEKFNSLKKLTQEMK